MFRALDGALPKDPVFASSLHQLGYVLSFNTALLYRANKASFIITEEGSVRRKYDPTKGFRYLITNNERYNHKHKEAVNGRSPSLASS